MTTNEKEVFFNKKQQYLMLVKPKNLTLLASRRFGKSEGVIMPRLLNNIQDMPRGMHGIVGATFKQILTRTLPATLSAIERMGYIEGMHYTVGKKAPKALNFKEPYIKPRDWEHVIHWYNGSISPLISQDVSFSSNSLTLSSMIVDEAKTIDNDKLTDETIPALTPIAYFQNCPIENSQTYVSDMPTSKKGSYLWDHESRMDNTLIEAIEHLICKWWDYNLPGKHFEKIRNEIEAEIDSYRRELWMFAVYNILDNLEIVGERYINDKYQSMTNKFKFFTAIMSKRIKYTEGGFYAAMTKKLYYSAFDNSYLNRFRTKSDTIDYKAAATSTVDCRWDADIDFSKPLILSSDTNINVNWLVIQQADYDKNTHRTIKSFFVKAPKMLIEVCKEFAEYYKPLGNYDVIFYYDHTFLQGRSGASAKSFWETIADELTVHGFVVTPVYIGQAWAHDKKHKEIDNGMKGYQNLQPLFNEHNNEALIIGMENTATRVGVNGWGKDKTGEKLDDSEEDPVEHRTDGGDAWDTGYIGACFYRADTYATSYAPKNSY